MGTGFTGKKLSPGVRGGLRRRRPTSAGAALGIFGVFAGSPRRL